MFEKLVAVTPGGAPPAPDPVAWVEQLAHLDRNLDDEVRIDLIRALEELKGAAAAAQAVVAADFDASQRAAQAQAGVPPAQQGRGVAAQVALARRESPHRGGQHLGLGKALVGEMPFTLAALTYGRISEWRATIVVRESACLSREDCAALDVQLCADVDRLESYGDRQLVAEAKKIAYRLDAESVVARARKAQSERCVSIRPAPDTMSYLTALLPVAQGVAVYAALKREADTLIGTGDGRSRGQIMADTLVERVTGLATAGTVPVTVNVTMTDAALFGHHDDASDDGGGTGGGGADEPAHFDGYGPVPAGIARDLLGAAGRAWVRRLYTSPDTGELIGMDSKARLFPKGLAKFLTIRDQVCRTPWCDAPVRHPDHVIEHQSGGPTTVANGQDLCEACNHTKQAHGWAARPRPGPVHTVDTTTPTGHTYTSVSPEQPGQTRRWIPTAPGVWTAA